MAGPGDEEVAGSPGQLRASRADRERVVGVIKAAFVQGMLAKDEFDLRVGQAQAPRTYAELAALTADLPAGLAVAGPSRPSRAPNEPMRHPGRMIAVATALYGGAWAFELFLSPDGSGIPWAPLLIFGSFCVYISVLLIGVMNIIGRRKEKRVRTGRQAG